MTEIELLRQFRESRSESAFAALVRGYTNFVYSVARRRMADAHLAEDITQLVFIKLARNAPDAETEPEFLGWLHRTTINIAIDTWRADSRRKSREAQAAHMQTANPDWKVISQDLDEALDRLSDEHREALLLRFFSAKSMREVGAKFGISEDAAKMRVSRALERLRSELGIKHASCTAAALSMLLLENGLEAAPAHLIPQLLKISVAAPSSTTVGSVITRAIGGPATKILTGVALTVGVLCAFYFWPTATPASRSGQPERAPTSGPSAQRLLSVSSSKNMLPQRLPVESESNLNFRLHVIEAGTQRPLPGTRVKYAYFGPSGEGESGNTITDEAGDADILKPEDPQKGGPNVFVAAEWHVPKVIGFFNKPVDGEYTVALERAREMAGWVVNEENQPVAGVIIHIQGPGNKPGQMENVDFQTCPVTTREDGSWSCSYVPFDFTNTIPLKLNKPGYAITLPAIPVSQVELTKLVLVIERGFTIEGHVTDTRNNPVPKARIKTQNWNSNERKSTETDEAGRFFLSGVAPYGKTVYSSVPAAIATNESGSFIIRAPQLRSPSDPAKLQQLEDYKKAATVRMRQLETGLENPDSANSFRGPEDAKAREVLNRSLQEADRKILEAREGVADQKTFEADLAVQAEGFAAEVVTVRLEARTNTVQIVVQPGKIFRGVVRDESGNPIPGVFVRTDMNFEKQIQTQFDWKTRTDEFGRFEWPSAPAEPVCYWFAAVGYTPVRGRLLVADGGEHSITLKRRARRSAAISRE